MKVGCYSLDLYCDHQKLDYQDDIKLHPFQAFPRTYTGRTEASCIRKAKADGWHVTKAKQFCPVCTGKNMKYFRDAPNWTPTIQLQTTTTPTRGN